MLDSGIIKLYPFEKNHCS